MDYFDMDYMNPLFDLLEKTKGVTQNPEYHPEVEVLNHSLQAMNWAFKEAFSVDLVFAAMLHDVGKAENPYGHDKLGAEMLKPYVSPKTVWLVRNHLRGWKYVSGEMRRHKKCVDLAAHPWFPELMQLVRFDKMGRNPNATPTYDRDKLLERFNRKADEHFKASEIVSNSGTPVVPCDIEYEQLHTPSAGDLYDEESPYGEPGAKSRS